MLPMYYGHMFNNPKDVPFAVFYVWALYYMVRSLGHFPRVPKGLALKLGLALGACLGVRVGGAVLVVYLGLATVPWLILGPLRRGGPRRGLAELWTLTRSLLLPVGAVAWCLMLVAWPWAQQSPILNPLRALKISNKFPNNIHNLFDGAYYCSDELPLSYIPTYFGIQLPELFLALLLLAPLVGLLWLWRGQGPNRSLRVAQVGLVAMAGFFPPLYIMAGHILIYDAVRHLIFITPALACLAGLTLAELLAWAGRCSRPLVLTIALAVVGLLVWQAVIMVRLHPYQYIYYNQVVGGLPGAYGRFETDYLGHSYGEAVQLLERQLRVQLGPDFPKRTFQIGHLGPRRGTLMSYFPPNFHLQDNQELADFFIAFDHCHVDQAMHGGTIILAVQRLGVPLNFVKDLRGAQIKFTKMDCRCR